MLNRLHYLQWYFKSVYITMNYIYIYIYSFRDTLVHRLSIDMDRYGQI